jgi:hypothetical protein
MKIFTIRPDDRFDITFRLVMCNTRKEMLSVFQKDMEKEHASNETGANTMGVFHPTPMLINTGVPGIACSDIFGAMYLNLADLSEDVILHECTHAAFAMEFNVRRYTGRFDDCDFSEQEEFCYFLGKCFDKVKKVIRQNYKIKGGKV